LASNHELSIQTEIHTIQNQFPQIPLKEILQWATLNGAKALGFDNRLGSFEKGKQPGMVWFKEVSEISKINRYNYYIID